LAGTERHIGNGKSGISSTRSEFERRPVFSRHRAAWRRLRDREDKGKQEMNDILKLTEAVETRRSKCLLGLALGAMIGVVCWAIQGALVGGGAVLAIVASAKVFLARGYVPYHSSFWGDVWFLASWMAAILGVLGLFAGAVIGARIGRRSDPGEPSVSTILQWTWNAFGLMLAILATKGRYPGARNIPGEPMEDLRDDMEATLASTAWGVVFLLIAAFLSIPTSWPVVSQIREMEGIHGVVTRALPGYNSVLLDVKYSAPGGEEVKGSFQRDGDPLPTIKQGDEVRLHPHVYMGLKTGAQVLLPGEQPDAMHSPQWARLYAGIVGGLLMLPFVVFFFNRAVRRS
jgi:hypothetical protein